MGRRIGPKKMRRDLILQEGRMGVVSMVVTV